MTPGRLAAVSPNARKLLATLISASIMGMSLTYHLVSQAFDFGDMMNPGRWMGGGRDRNDDYYGGSYQVLGAIPMAADLVETPGAVTAPLLMAVVPTVYPDIPAPCRRGPLPYGTHRQDPLGARDK